MKVIFGYRSSQAPSVCWDCMDSSITHVVQPSDIDYSELEQDLYTSILVVSGQDQKTIYFLSGHGEWDLDTTNAGPGGDLRQHQVPPGRR